MVLYDIKFDSKSETVQLVYPSGKIEIIANDSPTIPIKSPDKTKAVYIAPLEWEIYGNLYIVDLEKGEQEVLVDPEGSYIPKNVIWQDDENILVIIGFGDGTVCIGGNIFRVNVKTKEKIQITSYDSNVQITDLYFQDGMLHYKGIRYTDDSMNESEAYESVISLDSLLAY
jgi:hypothetical protein